MLGMDETRRQWGRNIAAGRILARMPKQQDLADALGVSRQSVSSWEKGASAPRDDMKVRIAELLEQDVHTLFPLMRGVDSTAKTVVAL